MNTERFREILEAYGTREENWPSLDRQDAQLFVQDNAAARQMLTEYSKLDNLLDGYLPRDSGVLREKILEHLPSSPMDLFIRWVIPEFLPDFWRPLLAGSLPLVVGILIGTGAWINVPDLTRSTDNWETEEVYFLALDESQISMELAND